MVLIALIQGRVLYPQDNTSPTFKRGLVDFFDCFFFSIADVQLRCRVCLFGYQSANV